MPKATVPEEDVPAEEVSEAPQEPIVAETPQPEEVSVKKPKPKPKAKPSTVDLKSRFTCQCGKEMSLHTAMYGKHKCPAEISVPQPPALTRQVTVQDVPEIIEPQLSQAQILRIQLAQHAQERRAQAHLRMVNPIRDFYGL